MGLDATGNADHNTQDIRVLYQRFERAITIWANMKKNGATDGTRTHDNSDHNRGLYQLSYGRHT